MKIRNRVKRGLAVLLSGVLMFGSGAGNFPGDISLVRAANISQQDVAYYVGQEQLGDENSGEAYAAGEATAAGETTAVAEAFDAGENSAAAEAYAAGETTAVGEAYAADDVVSGGDAVSGGNAGAQDEAVKTVQALIDALPDEVTAENADGLQAQLIAIDEALAALTGAQADKLNMTRYNNICAALTTFVAVQDGEHNHSEMSAVTDTLPAEAGNYYLTQNVTLTETWKPKNGTVLCLNGYSITMKAEADAITVDRNVTFTLYDCDGSGAGNGKITHGTDDNTNTKYTGYGVKVDGGIFNMYGGTITDNTMDGTDYDGGGVYVKSNYNSIRGTVRGTFNMYGGTISGNHADELFTGGGVYVNNSDFNMTDGEITGNTAYAGGGVGLTDGTVFCMTGGTISANNLSSKTSFFGGGVWVDNNCSFIVSGNATVSGNKDYENKDNNIELAADQTITVADKLTGRMGVCTYDGPSLNDSVVMVKAAEGYTLTAEDAACFTSDWGYYPFLVNGEVRLYASEPQSHPICGKECSHDDTEHPDVVWEGISYLGNIEKAGYYYLKDNVTLDAAWTCDVKGDVYLCLNGKTITGPADKMVLQVGSNTCLNITDCNDETGKITHASGTYGGGIDDYGTLVLWNGDITGNITGEALNNYFWYGGVRVEVDSKFTMHGGSITDSKGQYGGGVFIAENGIFEMTGGDITGNEATDYYDSSGGVHIQSKGTFIMTGGSITGNTGGSGDTGGGVYVANGSKFTMTGGDITGNTGSSYGGGGVYVDENSTFEMTGGVITENKGKGGGVYVSGSSLAEVAPGSFTMSGGSITGNKSTKSAGGGGVYVDGGDFTMDGGSITGNTGFSSCVGGVYLKSGTFNMKNGTISDNDMSEISYSDGGVHVGSTADSTTTSTATFTMSGGSITGNKAKQYGGGVYVGETGTFELTGGEITGNTSQTAGGGVYAADSSTFKMSGGSITGNTSDVIGGGVYVVGGKFTMSNGSITGNKAKQYGGGVDVASGSKFIMSNGSISGNTSKTYGGGVYVAGNGTFEMTGGSITGNMADKNGGGVNVTGSVSTGGVFKMSGGRITGNNTSYDGGGVYVGENNTTFTVSGEVQITGNWKNGTLGADGLYGKGDSGTKNNVLLTGSGNQYDTSNYATITIEAGLTQNARIGVSKADQNLPASDQYNKIATGASDSSLTYIGIFTSDAAEQGYVVTQRESNLYLEQHQHSWEYVKGADGAITATCSNTDNTCPNTKGGSVTIKAPAEDTLTYDGSPKQAAAVSPNNDWQASEVDYIPISYKDKEGNELTGAPTDAGTYTASITFTNADSTSVTAEVEYTIRAKELTDLTIEVEAAGNYDGSEKKPGVTVTDGTNEIAPDAYEVTYKNNTNAGEATVTIKSKEGCNYTFSGSKTFTITPATITVTPKNGQSKIYGDADPVLEYTVSGAMKSETPAFTGALSRADGKDMGDYAINLGTLALADGDGFKAGNYELVLSSTTVSFTIARRPVTITGITAKNKTYDGTTEAAFDWSHVKFEGILDNDSLLIAEIQGGFVDANAGKNKTVKINSISIDGNSKSNYTLAADGQRETTADIDQKELAITAVEVADKTYDGTTAAKVTAVTFDGFVDGESLTADDYTVSGAFEDASAGTGKRVTVTVTLKDGGNYTLPENSCTKDNCEISEAAAPTPAAAELIVTNKVARTYTFPLSGSLPTLAGQMEYGEVTYNIGGYSLEPAYYTGDNNNAVSIKDGQLYLPILAAQRTGKADVGTITVNVTSGNVEGFTLTIKVTATDKIVPRLDGTLTLEPAEITYGDELNRITTISGTMKDGSKEVSGKFTWKDGTIKPVVGDGTYSAVWKFIPDDTEAYEETTGIVTVKVNKATPTGEPKYTEITTEGKTLADAGLTLTGSTVSPGDGALEWVDDEGNKLSDETEVEVNKTYKWRFTPKDDNYGALTGEIELWHVDAPAISGQPKAVTVKPGEKAVFEVTATGMDLTYQWQIDRNDGKGFVDINGADSAAYTSGVTDMDCNGFKYRCVISNAAGSVTTAEVTLTVSEKSDPYKIINGADSSWTQNTEGDLVIRGNGAFSKFQDVKVDGKVIDAKNYTVKEGSTVVTLKADYLKTLSAGSHSFEIVWTDGSAGTHFTVALNNTPNDNDGEDDSNDTTQNTDAAVQTPAASPKTGDATNYVLWMVLLAASVAGAAGVLVKKKKE